MNMIPASMMSLSPPHSPTPSFIDIDGTKLNFVISSTHQTKMEQQLRRDCQGYCPSPNPNHPTRALFSLCRRHDWTGAIDLISANPEFCKWVGPYGQNLLHFICQRRPSVEAVRTILRIYPDAIMKADIDGCLPIHMAMTNGASHEVLCQMIHFAPESVQTSNKWGYAAFDWLWERCWYELEALKDCCSSVQNSIRARNTNNFDINIAEAEMELQHEKSRVWNTVELLIKAASFHHDQEADCGSTLLHIVSDFKDCPLSLVQAIVDEFPEMTTIRRDTDGRVPLASAAASPHIMSPTLIHIILLANQNMAMVPDNDGRLPIHLAIASGKSWKDVTKVLVECSPGCIAVIDPQTSLHPFMSVASKSELDTVYEAISFCVDFFNE